MANIFQRFSNWLKKETAPKHPPAVTQAPTQRVVDVRPANNPNAANVDPPNAPPRTPFIT